VAQPKLRAATEADRESFVSIWREAFREAIARWGWDAVAQRREAEAQFDEAPASMIEIKGRTVGYLSIRRDTDHDFVCGIALLPEVQRFGIGTELLRGVQEEARRRGVPLGLSVYVDNPARILYERLGFRVLRVEPPRVFMEWSA